MSKNLHPTLSTVPSAASEGFTGGTLKCHCKDRAVEVRVRNQVLFNHACGCTKCWKPASAIFSVVGVVPREKITVEANADQLRVVDEGAAIQRYACVRCGVHLFGRIENRDHAFYGLDFIHTELSQQPGWAPPEFAAFVSSVIEAGVPPSEVDGIREELVSLGLPAYDCLSPALMDILATHSAKAKGTYREA